MGIAAEASNLMPQPQWIHTVVWCSIKFAALSDPISTQVYNYMTSFLGFADIISVVPMYFEVSRHPRDDA